MTHADHPVAPQVDPGEPATFEGVSGGIIYGSISQDLVLNGVVEVEVFVNGIRIGAVSITKDAPADNTEATRRQFELMVPPNLNVEAPVTIRGRIAGTTHEIGNPITLLTPKEVFGALTLARGSIRLENGIIHGVLNHVNPAALPLTVGMFVKDELFEQIEISRSDTLIQKGRLLDNLAFQIPLPTSLLHGSVVTLSVRLCGSDVEFAGSPLTIAMTAGTSLPERLARLETQMDEVSEAVRTAPQRMVSDIVEQFYKLIVPRVDAIVTAQREMLEGQMTELWRQLSGTQHSLPRPGLPTTVIQQMHEAFTGFGWSTRGTNPEGRERWFAKAAFIAVHISPASPLLLKLTGSAIIGDPRSSGLEISANGRRLTVAMEENRANQWIAVAVISSSILAMNGVLGIQLSMQKQGYHPAAPDNQMVSASVETVELLPLAYLDDQARIDACDDTRTFITGWHSVEQTEKGVPFRWMGPTGILVPPVLRSPSHHFQFIEFAGPFSLSDILDKRQSFRVYLGAKELPRGEIEQLSDKSWFARFAIPSHIAGGIGAVLRLQAPAHVPPNDPRALSIAISKIVIKSGPVAEHSVT
ncbi:MAG: hypothetical protein AB7H90_17370 [Alphaproteobacteria bacterium]